MKRSVDIAIVGGGLAGSTLLQALIKQTHPHTPLSIAVFDKTGSFGAGMPYSKAMALPFLLLDQTQYLGRPDFIDWVRTHSAEIIHQLQTETPATIKDWAADLTLDLLEDKIDATHMPRRIFGDYLREQFSDALHKAASENISVETKTSTVTSLSLSAENQWHIQTNSNDSYFAKKVVLATGGIARDVSAEWCSNPSYCDSPYSQPLPRLQKRLINVLKTTPVGQRRIVIKGAHATAMEMVYAIYLNPNLLNLCEEIVVVSPGASFPRADISSELAPFVPKNLRAQGYHADPTAQSIWQAYSADHNHAAAQGYTIRDAENMIGQAFSEAFAELPTGEKRVFVHRCGKLQKALVRRMPPHYVNVAARLQTQGKLRFFRATVDNVSWHNNQWQISCGDCATPTQLTAAIFADCSGFSPLSQSGDPLWRQLLSAESQLKINEMDRGIIVDQNLLAAHNLYALGPMLGGTTNAKHNFWELMSINRITKLANGVASDMLHGLFDQRPLTIDR